MKESHNYAAAFVACLKGAPLEEVAYEMAIPFDTLQAHSSRHGWKGLIAQAMSDRASAIVPINAAISLETITENRAKNLKQATRLRDQLDRLIEMCAAEAAAIQVEAEESDDNDGSDSTHLSEKSSKLQKKPKKLTRLLDPKALRDLACAAATIHDLTYRALGDVPAKKDINQADRAPGTHISIHLPQVIAQPRNTRKTVEIAGAADQPEDAEFPVKSVTESVTLPPEPFQ